MLQQAIASFMAAGADVVTATQRAYLVMQSMIMRQAAMVSFLGIFRLLGVIFLVMLPLVLLMKRPTGRRGPVDVH
jgi:DHA2 family multidrug resistance protein